MTLRFAISFFCVSAMAQDLPDARALLKETSTILLQHKSYQLDQQAIFETQGSTPVRLDMLLKMAVSNPGKLRIESGGPLGKSLIVSDGEHSWMYLSALKQYTKTHAASTPESMVKMMLPGMTDPLDQINSKDPFLDVTISGEETVEVEGEKIPCYVVEAKLDTVKLTQSMQLSGVEKLWIDKKTRLTLKQTMSATLKAGALSDPAEVNQAVSVVSWKLDNEVPDETFHFTPPEDAQLVAEFRGLVKANSDLTGQSAPDFKLTSLDGKEFSLQNLRGKFVLLNFLGNLVCSVPERSSGDGKTPPGISQTRLGSTGHQRRRGPEDGK